MISVQPFLRQVQRQLCMLCFKERSLAPTCQLSQIRMLSVKLRQKALSTQIFKRSMKSASEPRPSRTASRVTSNDLLGRNFSSTTYDEEEEESEEMKEFNYEDELMEDTDYDLYLKEYCSIPGFGHRLYVIQPVMRAGRSVNLLTSGKLQLEEAVTLVRTVPRWTVVKQEMVNIRKAGQKILFTNDQFQKLTSRIRDARGISAVFVSSNILTDLQLSTFRQAWGLPVFDRYTLVLQIFKERARTKEAKLQVALAEVPYIRSRLQQIQSGDSDMQVGEARFAGGTGDSYIQLRNRILQEREMRLKRALLVLKKQRSVLRENRMRRKIPVVAVVGYTNSGKTTLIKALTNDQQMKPEDKLFATLDVTAHGGILPNHMKVIFIDTVGFISNIPVSLIAAFAATLEDAVLADVVLHVRDISYPDAVAQKHTVLQTLRRMLTPDQMKHIIEVCNKVDKLKEEPRRRDGEEFYVSATAGQGLNELCLYVQQKLLDRTGHMQKTLRIPMNGAHLSWLYKEATVVSTVPDTKNEENLIVNIIITEGAYAKFKSLFSKFRSDVEAAAAD